MATQIKIFILALLVIAVAMLGLFLSSRNNETPGLPAPSVTPSSSPTPQLSFSSKTADALVSEKGSPVKRGTVGGEDVYYYPTQNQYLNDEYFIKANKVVFIKERPFPLSADSYKKLVASIPATPTILYGPDIRSGLYLYSFPEKGVSFLANKETGYVYEVWRYSPTSLSQLLLLPQLASYSAEPKYTPENFSD